MASNTGRIDAAEKFNIPGARNMNQLQFNLQPRKAFSLETNFQKPKPLIIEKLHPAKVVNNKDERSYPVSLARSSSSLSSDRLELAMQMAKRDVKKLKNMLADPQIDISGILGKRDGKGEVERKTGYSGEQDKVQSRQKSLTEIKESEGSKRNKIREKKLSFGEVFTTADPEEKSGKGNKKLHFYDSEGGALKQEGILSSPEPKSKEISEIKRLRKELEKYMRRLDSVLEQKDAALKSVDAIKRKTLFEEETEQERKELRAEEQAARSARVLYMLQRKVQEIQDELEEKGDQVRHTKKSQSLTRLAAAHRAAVRALQMFVNQAPLYYDLKHGLPPIYSELGLLIQQLSLLSSHFDASQDLPDFDMDMLPRTKKLIASWNRKSNKQPKAESKKVRKKLVAQKQPLRLENKERILEEREGWIKQKLNDISQQGRKSNEPTPEREAALQAGIDALERAKESTSFIGQDVEKKRAGLKFNIPVKSGRGKSVLYPHRIKKFRQQPSSFRAKRPAPVRRTEGQEFGFAKQTVSSVLKKQPEIGYEPKRFKMKSPNRAEIPESVYVTYGTPKQRDMEIIKMASPKSPKDKTGTDTKDSSAVRFLDFKEMKSPTGRLGISEKEAARQAWLDRERDREIRRLNDLRQQEEDGLRQLSSGYSKAQDIVNEAEQKIKTQLQPLLDKAEFMSVQQRLREDKYNHSVKRKLADVITETAMSRGELLAELILDDILKETVHELERIENEQAAEANAVFERNKPTIESVVERLAAFEEEEERIRRRWKELHFSEIDISGRNEVDQRKDASIPFEVRGTKHRGSANPIIFTSAATRGLLYSNKEVTSHEDFSKVRTGELQKDVKLALDIPTEMKASIFSYRKQHENYLKRTIMNEHGSFNPWAVVEKISDEIVDEVVSEIQGEVDRFCDEFVEKVYKDEFLKNDSTISEVSVKSESL